MIHSLPQSSAAHSLASEPLVVWLPPERMRRYEWAKVIGAILVMTIFAGWLLIQWSNPFMRLLAMALLLMTAWITGKSILIDILRMRGRRLAVCPAENLLHVTQPQGATAVRLAEVAQGQWRDQTQEATGLWLLDNQGQTLVHLDSAFLADEAEARTFLNWLRQHTAAGFDVRWPDRSQG